ncbi:MAG TPA: DUF3459 domain-containing protein, partial [Vicinamibacterales bacterium]|nr:DUF3459 domain-containing protein [Vicinamibacterales bacterium]
RYENDWGKAINFEGPSPARAFFVENAAYWIAEFHLDGLRLDATQDIRDASPEHVIGAMVRAARDAAVGRRVFIVAENEPQDTRLVRPPQEGGNGCDALWNDDAHHAARVALTGRREAYYRDYLGTAQEFVSCAKYGYLYQGQWYSWQKKTRGTPALDLPPDAFVAYLENHDQVANSAFGLRLHEIASAARLRAVTAWLLLGPATPMLFQGQEFAASAPFLYFADHGGDLKRSIRRGRREFLAQFPSLSTPELQAVLPSPTARATFERCRLDWGDRERHASWYALHRDLLALRRADAVLAGPARQRVDGAVLGTSAFVLRFFGTIDDRLLVINLGNDLDFTPAGEPLLAAGRAGAWQLAWTSEAVEYGGHGVHPLDMAGPLTFPGNSGMFFQPGSEPRSSNLDPRP